MDDTEKKEITLLERFEKRAPSKSVAKRVYNLVKDHPFMEMSLTELLALKGIGRQALLLVTEVASDIMGKK
jgi:hypothetical protein